MKTLRTTLLASAAFMLAASPVLAQEGEDEAETTSAFGGQGGADLSIEAMEPSDEPVSVGTAGEDPADIARYLLASGASGGQLSPDGRTLAFSWSITGESQLWVMDAEGGQPRRLTFGSGITFYRWAPDGESLVYGADNDGNEQPAFYQISRDGLSERVLLPAAEGGFRSFGDFTGEGGIVYSSTERTGLDFDIWLATIDGETELVFEGVFAYYARAVSPSGEFTVVTESVGEDSDNLYLLNMSDGELTTVSAPEPRANHGGAGIVWARDGSGFYYSTNTGREFSALTFYDMASGESETLFEAEGASIADFALCGAEGDYLAYTINRDGFHELVIRDLASGDAMDTPVLPEGTYGLSCAHDAAKLAVTVNGWATPGDIHVIDLESGAARQSFEANLAGLDAERLIRPESVRITARDGVELQGLLYIPDESSREGEAAPVVFDVHGGPTAQSQASWEPSMQYLLDRGIAVFQPNVRGSTGFGRTYMTLDDREYRLDSVRDLVDMLDALEDDPRIDASRAAVRGGSYGGYMVNAVLAEYPGEFEAGVSLFGVADWVTALEVASPALKASDRLEYGDITEQRWRDFYAETSPIAQADRINVPVLYSHGVMDPRIDIYETEVMVTTLRENGVRADFIRIPDEGHGWRKLDNQLFYFRREAAFLEEMLMEDGEE